MGSHNSHRRVNGGQQGVRARDRATRKVLEGDDRHTGSQDRGILIREYSFTLSLTASII